MHHGASFALDEVEAAHGQLVQSELEHHNLVAIFVEKMTFGNGWDGVQFAVFLLVGNDSESFSCFCVFESIGFQKAVDGVVIQPIKEDFHIGHFGEVAHGDLARNAAEAVRFLHFHFKEVRLFLSGSLSCPARTNHKREKQYG